MKYVHPALIPLSKDIFFDWKGERFTLSDPRVAGDTHPQTWADDDNIYVGTGDPNWFCKDGKSVHWTDNPYHGDESAQNAMYGQAFERITGGADDAALERVHDMPGYIGHGGNGPKPCGMICVDGVIYYAVQNLLGYKTPPHRIGSQHGSDATIICSRDHGKTWEPDLDGLLYEFTKSQWDAGTHKWKTAESERNGYKGFEPMFPGSEFGGLSFVQYGKNNAGAPDGYVYAVSGDQWDNGKYLRLGRVKNDRIMDRHEWEFASLDSSGGPVWHKDIKKAEPILEIEGHVSLPEMVYIHSLNKYLLLTWGLHGDFYTPTGSELTILESDNIWGPFSLVHFEWMWDGRDVCAYTPRVPLKWFDHETGCGYILHSGNWGYSDAEGNWKSYPQYYRPHLKKFWIGRRWDKELQK